MNKEAHEVLEKILKKQLHELTEHEKGFLRARRSYLNAAQLETYADVLEGAKEEVSEKKGKEKKGKE